MMRTTLIHIAIILAPTVLYVLYLVAARKAQLSRGQAAATFMQLPWPWLIGSGVALAAVSLVALALTGGSDPEGTYVPPHMVDGEIVPAEVR